MRSSPYLSAGLAVVLVASIVTVIAISGGVASAQSTPDNVTNKTGYYDNTSTTVNNQSYFDGRENATLDNTVGMLTRLGTYIVGTDDSDTSLSGGATLVFGAIVWGAVLAMSSWSRTGMVGGGVLGTAAVAGLVSTGLAPEWLWFVVLLVAGGLLSGPVLRALD